MSCEKDNVHDLDLTKCNSFAEPGEKDPIVFECPDTYFKCPGNYCIPFHYVCDGEWQCPDGQDEAECGKLS